MTPRVPPGRRRIPHRPTAKRSRRLGWRIRLAGIACLLVVVLVAWAVIARRVAPTSNTSLNRFDAIIVLGSSANRDGNPTPSMLSRVNEAVHEYERGVAPRLIVTGGHTKYGFDEATVMARAAEAEGIPESAVFLEPQAMNTVENACYSVHIMQEHGWRSAEVVSNDYHLARTAMIFSRLPVEWRTHAAPAIAPQSAAHLAGVATVETLKTVRYLIWARWADECTP